MAAFTTIAAATVAVGSAVAKGVLSGDAASTASREAGRLNLEKEKLEEDAVATLEQDFYENVKVSNDILDRQLQQDNVTGATIIEAAQEGDQRGVAATAGKVKLATDIATDKTAKEFADQQLRIDMARAAANERDASQIAGLYDDRAQAAGVKADALTQAASNLEGQSAGNFLNAGVAALNAGVTAFGGLAGGKNAQAKAAQSLVDKSGGTLTMTDAMSQVQGMSNSQLSGIRKTGLLPSMTPPTTPTANTPNQPVSTTPETIKVGNMDVDVNQLKDFINQQNNKVSNDFMGGLNSAFNTNSIGQLKTGTFLNLNK